MITVNTVRDAVVDALKTAYPDSAVYDEEIRQGLRGRSFFVKLLTAGQDQMIGRRRRRMHTFDVHCFADTNEELHSVADTLYSRLEQITVPGGLVRGSGMKHEIVDRVLHFFVDYPFHVIQEQETAEKMQVLTQKETVKYG